MVKANQLFFLKKNSGLCVMVSVTAKMLSQKLEISFIETAAILVVEVVGWS